VVNVLTTLVFVLEMVLKALAMGFLLNRGYVPLCLLFRLRSLDLSDLLPSDD
jgi:hypothetical protein